MKVPTTSCSVSSGNVNAFNSPTITPAIIAPIAFVLLEAFRSRPYSVFYAAK